ncbi:cytochrome P450 [Cyathus striatus]|nr:cytochrome P450 [Cyathus striatus]
MIRFLLLFFILLLIVRIKRFTSSRSTRLPPGPPGRPVIGNLLDIPEPRPGRNSMSGNEHMAFGKGILVLNSLQAVVDLLEKRSDIYSDRPTFTMVGEMMGLDNSMPMLSYGGKYKQQRKLCHSALSSEAVKKYYDLQANAAAMYILSLINTPDNFLPQLRLTAGRIIMAMTYGIPLQTPDDNYIVEAEETMGMIGKAAMPGAHLVDLIPPLKYLPSWIPFNRIHKTAREGRDMIYNMVTRPLEHVKEVIKIGSEYPSFAFDCFKAFGSDSESTLTLEQEDTIRWTAGAMYGAGGETTYATVGNFIYAMSLYPEVQAKLKNEIFSVVGTERLPSIEDRPQLPYVNAAVEETLRWRPAVPLSIPRQCRKDDFIMFTGSIGYFIPAGTMVIPNVWSISKENAGSIPAEQFAPERFLHGKKATVPSYTFGFGRRSCPGKHLGENNIFILIAMLAATVDIKSKTSPPDEPKYGDGVVSYPSDFSVGITVTSRNAEMLVMEQLHVQQ